MKPFFKVYDENLFVRCEGIIFSEDQNVKG